MFVRFIWLSLFLIVSILLPTVLKIAQKILPRYNYEYGTTKGTINSVIPYLGLLVFVLFSKKFSNIDLNSPINKVTINGLLMTICFLGFGVQIFIFSRFSHYFKAFSCIIIPNIISKIENEKLKKAVLLMICIAAIVFVWITLSGTGYDPYYLSKELF